MSLLSNSFGKRLLRAFLMPSNVRNAQDSKIKTDVVLNFMELLEEQEVQRVHNVPLISLERTARQR